MNKPKNSPARKIIAENRKARFNFEILDTLEAGLVLTGTEVKSLRANQSNIAAGQSLQPRAAPFAQASGQPPRSVASVQLGFSRRYDCGSAETIL
jgi:hypothetical protein